MAILIILAAIVLPAATAVLDGNRAKLTQTTMQMVRNAIDDFADESPLGSEAEQVYGDFPPHDYSWGGGSSPNVESYNDTSNNGQWDYYEATGPEPALLDYNGNSRYDPVFLGNGKDAGGAGIARFVGVIKDNAAVGPGDQDEFRSIEAPYLFLTQRSSSAKVMIQQVPEKYITNQDSRTGGYKGPDQIALETDLDNPPWSFTPSGSKADERIDLFEITDTWGRPLQYEVRAPPTLTAAGSTQRMGKYRWELRSAGPDGKFSPMFTPQDQSGDDVIWPIGSER